ncbi:hypothetical protein Leryth_010129 [Lithospermum erythrorhizon]|uniref:DUF4408 domain-containing protein n=1 Tax=Lithospermum erythrorhizon TaxID=34254 RepID=A0AAV3R824_LITER|nr:hypothetical protein Leryth_010129 [Lithospermum erythrorhizon]
MENFKKSQILKLFFILAFLIITPLLSSSIRSAYLYLVLNILIIALGAESGLLSFISSTPEDHKKPLAAVQSKNDKQVVKLKDETETSSEDDQTKKKSGLPAEKVDGSVKLIDPIKKCDSTMSLFVAGKEEAEEAEEFVEDGEISEEELYDRAETFIQDFYKQLKMQREDSWQKLHGVYQQSILSQ